MDQPYFDRDLSRIIKNSTTLSLKVTKKLFALALLTVHSPDPMAPCMAFSGKQFLTFVFAILFGLVVDDSVQAMDERLPNIVFMMSDDQSWDGLSVSMHPEIRNSRSFMIETPRLQELAVQGMRFSAFYAPAPVCSPTRMSLMNGCSPAANGWTKAGPSLDSRSNPKLIPPNNQKTISESETTIAEVLRTAGYATAHFGKWHLSGGGPGKHGFDQHDGDLGNEHAAKFADPNPVDIFGMCQRAESFMSDCRESQTPFFIQLSWHALHAPQNASHKNVTRYRTKTTNQRQIGRMALASDLDDGVGRILDALDRLGLADNTYVIYTSDNGGGGGSGKRKVLSGGKGSVWEGGIRVPFIIRGPHIKANSWCHQRAVGYDLFPTFCELAGLNKPGNSTQTELEGGSLVDLLHHEGKGTIQRLHDALVFHFPHYQSEDGPHTALIDGDLKLIHFYESGQSKLFHLGQDIGEKSDLAASQPATLRRLENKLDEYLTSVQAQRPLPNPNYDPNLPDPTTDGKRGKSQRGRSGNSLRRKRKLEAPTSGDGQTE